MGYQGGYRNADHFYLNRSVNNRRGRTTRRLPTRTRTSIIRSENLSGEGYWVLTPDTFYSAARTLIATRLRTQRAGRFSPDAMSLSGPSPARGLPFSVSATITVELFTSGVISPLE